MAVSEADTENVQLSEQTFQTSPIADYGHWGRFAFVLAIDIEPMRSAFFAASVFCSPMFSCDMMRDKKFLNHEEKNYELDFLQRQN